MWKSSAEAAYRAGQPAHLPGGEWLGDKEPAYEIERRDAVTLRRDEIQTMNTYGDVVTDEMSKAHSDVVGLAA